MEENVTEQATVKSVSIKWGLVSTAISIAMFLILALAGMNAFDQVWGWVGMGIGVVILILAHKEFKDNRDGYMSYGQGIAIAFWIGVISTIIPGIFSYVYAEIIDPSVMDLMYQKQREGMEAQNVPEANIEMAVTWTKKLFWPIYAFIGIAGTVIAALIVTIFTQKKSPETNF